MNKNELKRNFKNPTKEWRGKPFWSWNGELTKEELNRQVGILKEMGFGGYFMHSRSGLITEYLGKDWFDLINSTADEGDRLDMESWLYDEDRWPSGSAGGMATVEHKYRMRSVICYEIPIEKYTNGDYKTDGEEILRSEAYLDGVTLLKYRTATEEPFKNFDCENGERKVLIFTVREDLPESNYNGNTYLDTMNLEAMNKFIELTHEKYAEKCGNKMGTSIKGIFTDEPHRGYVMGSRKNINGVFVDSTPWTNDLPQEFQKRYGYDLIPLLPKLFYKDTKNKFAKIKIDYIDLTNSLFIERFAVPYEKWCEEHNIKFTGHVLHEDSLSTQTAPLGSLMRFYEHMHIPGIDVLAGGHNNWWVAKQLDSAARQTGKKWKLSELYGCTGWETTFKDYKFLGDWQTLFGINLRCPHLSWYTMEGEAKRDYPASILHQASYYKDYNYVESYFARFGMFMDGTPICDTLVINPIESAWTTIYSGWADWIFGRDEVCKNLEKQYTELCNFLLRNHIDFDYGEEEMMSRLASVTTVDGKTTLMLGKCNYKTIIVSGMITMRKTTLDLLSKFTEAGGQVIFVGEPPFMINGEESDLCKQLSKKAIKCEELSQDLIKSIGERPVRITANGKEAHNVFYRLIDYKDGNLGLAIMNSDREKSVGEIEITVSADKKYAEEWCLETAEIYFAGNAKTIKTNLDAAATKTFILTDEKVELPQKKSISENNAYNINGDFEYELDEDNILVLDFCSWREINGEWNEELEVLKCDREIRKSYGLELRGGEMCQPWFTRLYQNKVFSEIELKYEFDAEYTDCTFTMAAERPEFMTYILNGTELKHKNEDGFWTDIAFKKMHIPDGLIRKGRNTLIVKTQFQTMTNVEAVYILGKFGVSLNGKNKTLTAMPKKIGFGNLDRFNLPFYSGRITYKLNKEALPRIEENKSAFLVTDKFNGSLIKVNGKVVAWEPYVTDITEALRTEADIEVELVCTRRNTFGPLHLFPVKHPSTGPGHFVSEGSSWKEDYVLYNSGIDELKIIIE